jgi:hypothetical protein
MRWQTRPDGDGVYWAQSQTDKPPSVCKVRLRQDGRWSVTFLGGIDTYVYSVASDWRWLPVTPPPRGRREGSGSRRPRPSLEARG